MPSFLNSSSSIPRRCTVAVLLPPTTGRLPTPRPGYAIRMTLGASARAGSAVKRRRASAATKAASLLRWVMSFLRFPPRNVSGHLSRIINYCLSRNECFCCDEVSTMRELVQDEEIRNMTSAAATISGRSNGDVSLGLDSEELASTYERVGTRQFNHGKLLIAALAPRPGERGLDIGCGTGRLGDYVAGLVAPDGEVVGVDPLPLRIDIAARKNRRFSASVGRAEDLSRFAPESFDF